MTEHENLIDLLALALPYVEEAVDDPCNKPAGIRALAKRIRAAIESADAPHLPRTDFADIYANPCVHDWLKNQLREFEANPRDIVDAYYDAQYLADLLKERVDGALAAIGCPSKS